MTLLALSHSFEYICYGSTAIENIFTLTVWGSTLDVRMILMTKVDPQSDIYRRQILMTKVDPRILRVNPYNAESFLFKFYLI